MRNSARCLFLHDQGRAGLQEAESALQSALEHGEGMPFLHFLPSLAKPYFSLNQFERRVAGLRCVEAVRMHAAAHDGKLPQALSDVRVVPIPPDPATGQPFDYRVAGQDFIIEGVPPAGRPAKEGLRLESRLAFEDT